jgi:hypothetical protein
MKRFEIFAAAAVLALAATTQVSAQGALPQGEGRDIVAVACTQCHALTPILTGREGAAGWKKHVHNMVLRGAQLSPAEAETVVRYLTANFGPGAAPPGKVAVTLPAGAGKELSRPAAPSATTSSVWRWSSGRASIGPRSLPTWWRVARPQRPRRPARSRPIWRRNSGATSAWPGEVGTGSPTKTMRH